MFYIGLKHISLFFTFKKLEQAKATLNFFICETGWLNGQLNTRAIFC